MLVVWNPWSIDICLYPWPWSIERLPFFLQQPTFFLQQPQCWRWKKRSGAWILQRKPCAIYATYLALVWNAGIFPRFLQELNYFMWNFCVLNRPSSSIIGHYTTVPHHGSTTKTTNQNGERSVLPNGPQISKLVYIPSHIQIPFPVGIQTPTVWLCIPPTVFHHRPMQRASTLALEHVSRTGRRRWPKTRTTAAAAAAAATSGRGGGRGRRKKERRRNAGHKQKRGWNCRIGGPTCQWDCSSDPQACFSAQSREANAALAISGAPTLQMQRATPLELKPEQIYLSTYPSIHPWGSHRNHHRAKGK